MMYEGEDTNSIDLLYEKETTESNGVKVIIPVDYSDRHAFVTKIKEQLAYFESVYFDIESKYNQGQVTNDFLIHRAEHFQFSSLSINSHLHLSLDNVYYPIDFSKLGIPSINIPIALRFNLSDGLFPTPNREALRYTQEAKTIILDKIQKVANVFMEKYNSTITGDANPISIIQFYSNDDRLIANMFSKDESSRLNISELLKYATATMAFPKMNGVDILDFRRIASSLKDYFLGEYQMKFKFRNGKFNQAKNYYAHNVRFQDICPNWGSPDKIYLFSDVLSKKKQDYLRTHLSHNINYIFVKKVPFYLKRKKGSPDYQSYYDLLSLQKYPKKQWRQVIQEFQKVLKFFEDMFIDADKIEIPQKWIDEQKAKRIKLISSTLTVSGQKKVRMKGEFSGKVGEKMQIQLSDQYCKFTPKTFKLEEIQNVRCLHVYAKEADRKRMDCLWSAFNTHVNFVIVAESTYKNLQTADVHNWITMDKFMEGKNRPFRTMATTFLIEDFENKYNKIFTRVNFISLVSSDLSDKINILSKFLQKNNKPYADFNTKKEIVEFAKEHNLFDQETYIIYKQVNEVFEKLSFLNNMMGQFSYRVTDPVIVKAVADLFKYHKHKVNLEHYAIKLNEDKPLEQELTEETIEELQNN